MGKLINKIQELEQRIKSLESKIVDLSEKTENVRNKPESIVPQLELGKQIPMPSSGTGLGKFPARQGGIIWNDADASATPWGEQPPKPERGYNKHSHSRFAGGALDIHTLELVEYEDLDVSGHNRDCQSFWKDKPKIAKDGDIEKIGLLDITFDTASKKWLAGGIIDVEKTNLVQYTVENGEKKVKKDSKNREMKAPLLGSAIDKENIVWDEIAQCWRFYAVYSD